MANFTQSDLTALNAAIALGARKVQFRDRTVEYHSLNEMLELQARMIAELNPPSTTTDRCIRTTYDRGYQ
jgi:hypothetical protein